MRKIISTPLLVLGSSNIASAADKNAILEALKKYCVPDPQTATCGTIYEGIFNSLRPTAKTDGHYCDCIDNKYLKYNKNQRKCNLYCPTGSTPTLLQSSNHCNAGSGKITLSTYKNNVSFCCYCSSGTFSDGTTECKECAPGTYSKANAGKCTQCEAGTYNNQSGSSGCTYCGVGYYSNTGATSCLRCNTSERAGNWYKKYNQMNNLEQYKCENNAVNSANSKISSCKSACSTKNTATKYIDTNSKGTLLEQQCNFAISKVKNNSGTNSSYTNYNNSVTYSSSTNYNNSDIDECLSCKNFDTCQSYLNDYKSGRNRYSSGKQNYYDFRSYLVYIGVNSDFCNAIVFGANTYSPYIDSSKARDCSKYQSYYSIPSENIPLSDSQKENCLTSCISKELGIDLIEKYKAYNNNGGVITSKTVYEINDSSYPYKTYSYNGYTRSDRRCSQNNIDLNSNSSSSYYYSRNEGIQGCYATRQCPNSKYVITSTNNSPICGAVQRDISGYCRGIKNSSSTANSGIIRTENGDYGLSRCKNDPRSTGECTISGTCAGCSLPTGAEYTESTGCKHRCKAGYYSNGSSDNDGPYSCSACPSGMTSPAGSTSKDNCSCASGYHKTSDGNSCELTLYGYKLVSEYKQANSTYSCTTTYTLLDPAPVNKGQKIEVHGGVVVFSKNNYGNGTKTLGPVSSCENNTPSNILGGIVDTDTYFSSKCKCHSWFGWCWFYAEDCTYTRK